MITILTILAFLVLIAGFVFLHVYGKNNKEEYRKAAIYCFGIAAFIFIGNLIVINL